AAFGVGTLFAALTVAYRDFRHVVPFLTQLWMFSTPIIYLRAESLGPTLREVLPLNPAYGLIAGFRDLMLGGESSPRDLAISTAVALVFLITGLFYFRRVERAFADVI
ncbi:MAG: ABC transporter permease, partial [Isosphaeraceae bacterium]